MVLSLKKRQPLIARTRHWKAYVDQWTDVITLVKNRKGGVVTFNAVSAEDVISGLSGEVQQLALDCWIPLKAKLAAMPSRIEAAARRMPER
jgi:hypothetical protein